MKKLIYYLVIIGAVFTGCNPMEDINSEIDAVETDIVGDVVYELTDDDYETLELNYGNFNSVDDAKSDIPGLLADLYPVWGNGSSALVTFKWYNPVKTYEAAIYELSDDEHNAITGNFYGNFDRDYHIYNYLDATYPTPDEGDFVSLKYRFYAGGESTLTDGFAYEDGEWVKFTGFTEDQYKAMGEGYPNFSSEDEANTKIPVALLDVYKYNPKSAGDIVLAMYELYVGGGVTESYTAAYIFDGTAFSAYTNVATETIQFGHDGTTWVPDNTIKYTLTQADYDLVDNGYYANFDVRAGKAEETIEVRLGKINTILLNNFPSDEEGQKYVVSYNVYNGAAAIYTMKVIKSGGEYILNE
ncbi:hypothetical protein [Algibacter sp.]|uniref:hypothetical protein n=1 Tax=Algibacter sp. TaxID=1872428 RepID=UPI003C72393C